MYSATPTTPRKYPNPGYLGTSSHATIYGLLPPDVDGNGATSVLQPEESEHRQPKGVDDGDVAYGAQFVEELRKSSLVPHFIDLVECWINRGVNLALAGVFTKQCAEAAGLTLTALSETHAQDSMEVSRRLFNRSNNQLNETGTTMSEFSAQFCRGNARWETIGLFFTAVGRATVDLPYFDPLYRTREERRMLQKRIVRYSQRCLDIALSLDCMNDLQLLLLYENFIMHSFVDGDQSFFSWRRLGDVISSLYALGYHERTDNDAATPTFLSDLRKTAFARAYSADKNLSIFLGRPPRMQRNYCSFEPPGSETEFSGDGWKKRLNWKRDAQFDYTTDTRWSVVCAILKEQILELHCLTDSNERFRKSSLIQADAEAQWQALPSHLRLEGLLSHCEGKPSERDLLVSMRLNHLHVLLLLRLALVRHVHEPDMELIAVATSMLSLTVQAIVLKDSLANSGTSLVWRVAYYGLPAAGIISLSLLNQSYPRSSAQPTISKAFQDLSVLVAEVETGALVHFEEPNYKLLAGATRTIKSILDRCLSLYLARPPATQREYDATHSGSMVAEVDDAWMPLTSQESWDFDIDFWLNLAEHPALVDTGEQIANF